MYQLISSLNQRILFFFFITSITLSAQCEKPVAISTVWGFCRGAETELKTLQDGIDLNLFKGDDSKLRYYSGEFSTVPLELTDELIPSSFVWVASYDEEVGCESSRQGVIVQYFTTVKPTGESLQIFCINKIFVPTINDIVTESGNKYYLSNEGGINVSGTTPLEDGNTYYISHKGSVCESERLAVTVILECTNLSLSIFELSDQITLYPNPVQNRLTIESKNGITIEMVEIYSLQGHLLQRVVPVSESYFDVSNLLKGIYIVKVITNQGITTTKLFKE